MSIQHRYDFVLLFDVLDGNPNGDPDAGNLPRVDPETGCGLVTDVCLKRKLRNYVTLKMQGKAPYEIYVKEKAVLNDQNERAYTALGVDVSAQPEQGIDGAQKQQKRKGGDKVAAARDWMCQNFYDVRTFGAVMSIAINCGQVRGPVQMTFARSINPVVPLEHSITRMAVATKAEAEKQEGDNRTMGRKHTISYGLYKSHGFVSACLAQDTKFSQQDLELLWEALVNMFEHDRSAARGLMATRALVVFKHDSHLGNASAHGLFERVSVRLKAGVQVPRDYSDYEVVVDETALPSGVEVLRLR